MISSLRGKLIYNDNAYAVVECSGVGFKCFITHNTASKLPKLGDEVFLNTYLAVREDALDLYGFFDADELECFKLITSVNGVGAKIGIALLSDFTASEVILYIASGDAKALTKATGVGIKLAQRILLELKDKVGSLSYADTATVSVIGNATVNSNSKEAVEALVSLGFSQSEAAMAVGRLDQSLSAEDLIKQALKALSRRA